MNTYAIKKNLNNAAMFFICTLGAAFSGFLAGYFSGVFNRLILDEWFAALIYAAVCLLSGFCLFSILSAQVKNRTYYLVRNWAVLLWFVQFVMFIIAPFLLGAFAYVLLSMLSAVITALAVLCFKLRFVGAVALLAVLAWIIFLCFAVLSAI